MAKWTNMVRVRIRGELQPLDATHFTDIKLMFSNLEMNRLTPYSGQFAGRRIDAGKLSVDLEYKIKARQLLGANKFVIHKIKLGEKIASKDALDLPLDLAIAILEDSDGVIDLDLPIAGSLDDPQFSYGSIVWKAIKNVLTKIVTAPFRALGKLFGGNSEKPDAILFDAGTATLNPPELEKLHNLSAGLTKRPGLAIAITPSYNVALDTRAMQTLILRRQIAEKIGQKLDKNQTPGPINLTDTKTQKTLDDLYDDLTHKSLLKKITTAFKKPEAGHFEMAQEKLTQSIEVTEADLQALAKARGEIIAKQLLAGGVLADKVRLQPAKTVAADASALVPTALTLDVK